MKTGEKLSLCLLLLIVFAGSVAAQELITNVYGRNIHSLNGKWNAIIDLYDQGQRMKIYENRQPEGNIDFYEYAFEGGLRLNVPGDWNSQSPELKYYEGTVWYAVTLMPNAWQTNASFFISVLSAIVAKST